MIFNLLITITRGYLSLSSMSHYTEYRFKKYIMKIVTFYSAQKY